MRTLFKRAAAMIALIALVVALLPPSALAEAKNGRMPTETDSCTAKLCSEDVLGIEAAPHKAETPERSVIWDGSIAAGFAEGTGAEEDPYLISSGSELAYLAQQMNAGSDYSGVYFKLTNDICLNDTSDWESWGDDVVPQNEWTAIGGYINNDDEEDEVNISFNGCFDGDGHAVRGVYINSQADFQGLFGCNTMDSIIANLGVAESYVSGVSVIGGIAGVIGCNYGNVINCYNMSNVVGNDAIGGVVGCNYGNVTNCYNTGNIIGTDVYIGGVVGLSSGSVTNCYNTGSVAGDYYVGGVIGEIWSSGTITDCYNIGNVNGTGEIGGVVGFIFTGTVTDCYYDIDCCVGGNSHGKALTSEQLLLAESFVGFDFDTVWTMDGNPDYPYPELIDNIHGGTSIVTPEPGDADGDGVITIADATLIARMALNLSASVPAADFNGDGNINMADATLTARKALNLI